MSIHVYVSLAFLCWFGIGLFLFSVTITIVHNCAITVLMLAAVAHLSHLYLLSFEKSVPHRLNY